MQDPRAHDQHPIHLVPWKVWYTWQKPVWLQEASQHCGPPSESRQICPGCLCTETTGGWSLLRPGEGLWNKLAVWYHQRPAQDRIQRPIVCLCSRVSSQPPNSSQNRHHTLWWILPKRRSPNWWCIGCCMFWAKYQRAATSYRQGYLQSTLCWWPGDLVLWPLPGHHRETFAAGS